VTTARVHHRKFLTSVEERRFSAALSAEMIAGFSP